MQDLCPCCSGAKYIDCCGRFLEFATPAQTAEQLMRSRYSAYSMANIDYIAQTQSGVAALNFDKHSAKNWAQQTTWLRLDVINSQQLTSEEAEVEFSAKFMNFTDKLAEIHELSKFKFQNGSWFYISGEMLPATSSLVGRKIPLNSRCPCGSGRKYKSCHGAR